MANKPPISIRIPNLYKMQRALIEMGASKEELQKAAYEAGQITARSVQAFINPISRTGKLRSTVKASKIARKVVVTVGNNTTAPYANPINFGWLFVGGGHEKSSKATRPKKGRPNIKPARFMEKALKATRQRVLDTYLDELQKLANKYERKVND
jgi:hypothetical protein